ncbi:response regulator, partial [Vibrio anguillarum]|nr:response regulator [Vibrio anguillarum]
MPIENLDNCTVLIVDDSPDNLAFMSQGLANRYHVKAAKSGPMALSILDKFSIDLVLLDIVMPEMSGFEVIQKIMANPNTQDIP